MERRKRRWWTRGITWLSLVVISGAVLSGLFQLAVALAPGYREEVAQRASAALGQPVQVDKLSLRWRWLTPLLELKGVRLLTAADGTVGSERPVVDVQRIRLGFGMGELLGGEWIPSEVEIDGVALAAEITAEGHWQLRGHSGNRAPPTFDEIARALKRFSRLRAERVTLSVVDRRDAKAGFTALLQRADLRIDTQGFELRAELQAPEVIASRLRLRAGMAGDLAQPADWQGRWTLDASGIAPGAPLLHAAPAWKRVQWADATLTASGDWQQGAPGASELSLRAQSLALAGDPASTLRDVDLGLHYRPSAEGGTLDVVPLRFTGRKGNWPTTTARLDWRRESAREAATTTGLQWRGSSDFLRLDDLGPWAAALLPPHQTLPPAVLRSLRGDVSALEVRWQPTEAANPSPQYSLHARFTDLAASWPDRGSVQGLQGEVTADERSGRATLKGEPLGFELPTVFAGPQRAGRIEADAQWQRDSEGWQLKLPRLDWSLLGSQGQASAELRWSAATLPQLKLQARFDVADVTALKPLMLVRWGQPLKDWLHRAVVRGRISKAVLNIDGPLADFPFHARPTGQWSLALPVSGARLEFHPDWPGIDQLAAVVRFAGNGLSIESPRGVINGVAVTGGSGGIADFSTAPLVIDGRTAGEAPFYYGFLRASPLAGRLRELLAHSEAEGPVEADVHVEVPLHSNLGQKTVASGEVRLQGNNLRHSALDHPVRDITGTLHFGTSVQAQGLKGTFYDNPVSANLGPSAEGNDQLDVALRVDLEARDGIAAHYVPSWLLPQLRGASDWQVAIPLAGPHSGRVRLSSTLVGSSTALPAPLAKRDDEAWPITLDLASDASTPLAIIGEIPGRLGLALRFARAGVGQSLDLHGLGLRLGPGEPLPLPTADGWRLNARLDTLEPEAWSPLIVALRGSSGSHRGASADADRLPFLGADLSVQRLRLAGYDVPALGISARREYGGYAATLQGEGTAGSLKLSSTGDALSGRFGTLQLQPAPKQVAANAPSTGEPLDPTKAPTLDFTVDALRIGGQPFGELALATERSPNGQRLRRLALQGGIATLTAEGEWRRTRGMTEAQSRFSLASDDLAGTLEALGYAATVSGRNARIDGDLTWPAAARGFDWAFGRGKVSLAVEEGALRTVEPGNTSRVMGLFNFYALPRRFTLDFGDVTAKGLGFDRIEGSFQLANGTAHTDDLTVRGPSVRIDVRGDVGLAAHDYNEVITVTPNTKGITLGALLLGGASSVAAPILPVIAVIANQVLDKPLGQVTQLTYGLTGSWENPEFKKVEQTAETPPTPEEASKP